MINKINLKKQSIHGYGASTKGNVLLQYFNISNKSIKFIAERNNQKFNSFTPGTKIKFEEVELSNAESLFKLYELETQNLIFQI